MGKSIVILFVICAIYFLCWGTSVHNQRKKENEFIALHGCLPKNSSMVDGDTTTHYMCADGSTIDVSSKSEIEKSSESNDGFWMGYMMGHSAGGYYMVRGEK